MILNNTKHQINCAKQELAEYIAANDGKQWNYEKDAEFVDVDYKSITLTIHNVNGIVRVMFPQIIDIWDDEGCPIASITIKENPGINHINGNGEESMVIGR